MDILYSIVAGPKGCGKTTFVVFVTSLPHIGKLSTRKDHVVLQKGKESRTISINAQYMVLFKNPRDNTQVVNLAKQMYPGRVKYMQGAFRDAMSVPHG